MATQIREFTLAHILQGPAALMVGLADLHWGRSVGTARKRWSRDDVDTFHVVDPLR